MKSKKRKLVVHEFVQVRLINLMLEHTLHETTFQYKAWLISATFYAKFYVVCTKQYLVLSINSPLVFQ